MSLVEADVILYEHSSCYSYVIYIL